MGHRPAAALTAIVGPLVLSLGCGPQTAATEGETSSTETTAVETTTETTETETTETETETGDPEPPEPLECMLESCYRVLVDGPFAQLAGVEPSVELECALQAVQSTWWIQGFRILERIDGVQHDTDILVDARGGAVVTQSNETDGYTRVEHCELAPAEFFAACLTNFDAACADLDNWFGPCTSEDLACPSGRDCGLPTDVCDQLDLGPDSLDDPTCVWTILRDAEQYETMLDVDYALINWHYQGFRFHLDAGSRNVGGEGYEVDDVTHWRFIGRCELQPPAFFQACLDDPTADPSCELPRAWVTDCVEQPQPCQ